MMDRAGDASPATGDQPKNAASECFGGRSWHRSTSTYCRYYQTLYSYSSRTIWSYQSSFVRGKPYPA